MPRIILTKPVLSVGGDVIGRDCLGARMDQEEQRVSVRTIDVSANIEPTLSLL